MELVPKDSYQKHYIYIYIYSKMFNLLFHFHLHFLRRSKLLFLSLNCPQNLKSWCLTKWSRPLHWWIDELLDCGYILRKHQPDHDSPFKNKNGRRFWCCWEKLINSYRNKLKGQFLTHILDYLILIMVAHMNKNSLVDCLYVCYEGCLCTLLL